MKTHDNRKRNTKVVGKTPITAQLLLVTEAGQTVFVLLGDRVGHPALEHGFVGHVCWEWEWLRLS